ncbi:hypothetical protein FTUN_3035 [Frigoriglobus tundricola]|uniref:Uncharacterized protein n=1 Tax=Frigoriglobus tundricola TaxID=2774151 RepID=A0A6M5YQ52_9BACT|nr:hypothetical protein FTUN_3035 [Frigoriglobus tundricola]
MRGAGAAERRASALRAVRSATRCSHAGRAWASRNECAPPGEGQEDRLEGVVRVPGRAEDAAGHAQNERAELLNQARERVGIALPRVAREEFGRGPGGAVGGQGTAGNCDGCCGHRYLLVSGSP